MNINVDNKMSVVDGLKWGIAVILLVGGIIANSYYASEAVAIRLSGWLVLVCIVAGIIFYTSQGRKVWGFFQEAQIELRKVIWPTRQEVIQVTLMVVAVVVITALFLWGMDSLLLWLVGILTGSKG